MSDAIPLNMAKVSADVQARVAEHEKQLGYLKESLVLAKKMGEDTKDAERYLESLEALLASMRIQLKTLTRT
jgi:hypothetical protein